MIPSSDFPRLTSENHKVTSAADVSYNCIAWAARDTQHWWQPGRFWPVETAAGDFGIGILALAFKTLGYEDCVDANYEPGFEKVALYGDFSFYKHAARQLSSGAWTSKLGKDVDIEHDTPDDVAGGLYGEVVQLMTRPSETPPQTAANTAALAASTGTGRRRSAG